MRNRVASDDSPKLNKASMTPPNSLGRKRKGSGSTAPKETTRKTSNSSLTNFLSPPLDSLQNRVASPDLPVFHYCNIAMQGSGSVGKNDNSGPANTLTQSQILHPGARSVDCSNNSTPDSNHGSPARSSRTVSRSSNDSVVFVAKQPEPMVASPLVAQSEPNIVASSNGKLRCLPTSSHGNINMCAKQAPFLPGIQETQAEHKQTMASGPETRSEYEGESDAISSKQDSLTNSEIVAINSIMSEIGHPEQGVRKKGTPRRKTLPDTDKKLRSPPNNDFYKRPDGPVMYRAPPLLQQRYQNRKEDDALLPPVSISTVPVKNAPKVSVPLLPKQASLPDARTYMLPREEASADNKDGSRSKSNSPVKASSLPGINGPVPNAETQDSDPITGALSLVNDISGPGARPMDVRRKTSIERNVSSSLSSTSSSSDDSPPPLPPPPADHLLETTSQRRSCGHSPVSQPWTR